MENRSMLHIRQKWISILLFAVYSASTHAQGNWQQILPPGPTSNQMIGLFFIDEITGWSVGEYGTILKTTDGAESWRIIEVPWLNKLLDVYFPTAATGFVVGQNGLILKSVDGGESWIKIDIRYTNNLHRVVFRNTTQGWVIGEKGLILYTSDGGESWQQQTSQSREDLKGIAVVDDSTLVITGKNRTLLLTHNDGQIWQANEPAGLNEQSSYDFNDVYFIDENRGWIGGSETITDWHIKAILFKTTDGGRSWNEIIIKDARYQDKTVGRGGIFQSIVQVYFYDDVRGICTQTASEGYSGEALVLWGPFSSRDGGASWYCEMPGRMEMFSALTRFFVLSPNRIIRVGYRGEFIHSDDGGQTWKFPNTNARGFDGFRFRGAGKVLAFRYDEQSGFCNWVSLDRGCTWKTFVPKVYDYAGNGTDRPQFSSLGFSMKGSFWKIGYESSTKTYNLYESHDDGNTWYWVEDSLSSPEPYRYFLNPDTVISYKLDVQESGLTSWVAGLIFYYSHDGSRSYRKLNIPGIWNELTPVDVAYPSINSHFFINGLIGYLAGSDGNILKTVDGGQSWKNVNSGVSDDLLDVQFLDKNTGFAVGKFGRILKTEDGGESWRKTNSGTQEAIYTIAFKNNLEGWVGTESGLRYTINGGETWQAVPLRYQHGPVCYINFDPQGNFYASRNYVTEDEGFWRLWKLDPPWESFDYEYLLYLPASDAGVRAPIPRSSPVTLQLEQNYPNPFNANTTICYHLGQSGKITLEIYNLQGQLLRTLVQGQQQTGPQMERWDGRTDNGSAASSGVYLYKLQTEDMVKSKKMILLR